MSILSRVFLSGLVKKPKEVVFCYGLLTRNIHVKPKSKYSSYFLNKYVNFIKSYDAVLRKKFPAAVKVYQVFSVGVKYFKEDIIILFKAYKKGHSKGFHALGRKELQVYQQMKKDMIKVGPILILAAIIPFGGCLFIIGYFYPRHLLSHHFWSLQQKSEFSLINHKKKLKHYEPVLRNLQTKFRTLKVGYYSPLSQVLKNLEEGMCPSYDEILKCKPFFEKEPFALEHLSRKHTLALLNIYKMHRGFGRKRRLFQKAYFIRLLDSAIIKEGGVEKLTQDEIKWNCFYRGLNPINMRNDDVLTWLSTWLLISKEIGVDSFSLLLHCPVLLGLNQPSNLWLLNDKRIK